MATPRCHAMVVSVLHRGSMVGLQAHHEFTRVDGTSTMGLSVPGWWAHGHAMKDFKCFAVFFVCQ